MSAPTPQPVDAPNAGIRELLPSGTVHFMGIGGAGMCALAEAIVRHGGRVSGCDLAPGDAVRPLERLGVRVRPDHDPEHIGGVVGLVVSSAVRPGHPEIVAAREAGIPVWKRAQALGEWVNTGLLVAVAGTHGKTTTTAMVTEILARGGKDPTGFVGGWVQGWGGHLRPGGDDLFVVEADEYDRSFHQLRPSVALVTNMDSDHLDVYGDLPGVRAGFVRFLEGIRAGGTAIVCADDPGEASLVPWLPVRARSYGFSAGSQLRGVDFTQKGGGSRFRVIEEGADQGLLELTVPGRHNALNALGAAAVARALGIEWSDIRSSLNGFQGVTRRFQFLGEENGIVVVDDYAHHPREIEAVISTARAAHPDRRLVVVFQPHLFTRTRDFASAFGSALAAADVVWVSDIYAAREEPIPGVDGELVAREVRASAAGRTKAVEVHLHGDLESLPGALAGALHPGDLCLTLGAGSIEGVGQALLDLLKNSSLRGAHV